ncbi:MAG: PLP-dependent aspartate aminotransferase family protein [Acidobacteriota bacterium]
MSRRPGFQQDAPMGIATDAIHAGCDPVPGHGAIMTPIHATSTYVQTVQEGEPGEVPYDYARTINPTRSALETNIAALEAGTHGRAFASGMAAIDAIARLCSAGDHVICGANVYGGTYRLFSQVLARQGLEFSFVDSSDPEALKSAVRDETKLIHVETPTNPMMQLTDIPAVAAIAKDAGALLCVDNTFMSPVFQRPLELGADIVVHSTTKFINGHSDSIGGALAVKDAELDARLGFLQKSAGAILSPFDSFLVLRGIKTLVVRMRAHDAAGRELAGWLNEHDKVDAVLYPGLPSHPQHELAKTQMSGFGAMISFVIQGDDLQAARRFLKALKICALAESLGGVETLISHPATMTHASVPAEDRAKLGLSDGLVRISVGLEDLEDLRDDLEQGLAAV